MRPWRSSRPSRRTPRGAELAPLVVAAFVAAAGACDDTKRTAPLPNDASAPTATPQPSQPPIDATPSFATFVDASSPKPSLPSRSDLPCRVIEGAGTLAHDGDAGARLPPGATIAKGQAVVLGEGGVALHLPLALQGGIQGGHLLQRLLHLPGLGVARGAEAGVGDEGQLGGDAEAADLVGGQHGDVHQLLRRGVDVDVGVGDEQGPALHHHRVHRRVGAHAPAQADHLVDVLPVQLVHPEGAAEHPVGVAEVHGHGADQGVAAADLQLGVLLGDALALGEAVVGLPVVAVAVGEVDGETACSCCVTGGGG